MDTKNQSALKCGDYVGVIIPDNRPWGVNYESLVGKIGPIMEIIGQGFGAGETPGNPLYVVKLITDDGCIDAKFWREEIEKV